MQQKDKTRKLRDFQPMWFWSTNVTKGGWRDDMQSQYRALHCSAFRGKNSKWGNCTAC